MDARCEVCGLDVKVSDEELARREVVEVECEGCGARRRIVGARSREASPASGAEDDERLEDLRAIARRSLAPPSRDEDASALDAPPSVRELIRAGEAIALFDSRRAHRRRVAMGVAVAIVAIGTAALALRESTRAHTRTGVSVDAPAAEQPAAEPERSIEAPSTEAAPHPLASLAPSASLDPAASENENPRATTGGDATSEPGRAKAKRSRKRAHGEGSMDSTTRDRADEGAASAAEGDAPSAPSTSEDTPAPAPSLSDAIAQAVGAPHASASATPFDRAAALAVLRSAASGIPGCKLTSASVGSSGISVRFVPSGSVDAAAVDGPPFAGTPTGQCIEQLFRKVHVPPFSGPPVIIHRPFTMK